MLSSGFGLIPAKNQVTGSNVSFENLNELDADLLVIFDQNGERKRLESDPRFAKLPSSSVGKVYWLDSFPLAVAINTPDSYSWEYLIKHISPNL